MQKTLMYSNSFSDARPPHQFPHSLPLSLIEVVEMAFETKSLSTPPSLLLFFYFLFRTLTHISLTGGARKHARTHAHIHTHRERERLQLFNWPYPSQCCSQVLKMHAYVSYHENYKQHAPMEQIINLLHVLHE